MSFCRQNISSAPYAWYWRHMASLARCATARRPVFYPFTWSSRCLSLCAVTNIQNVRVAADNLFSRVLVILSVNHPPIAANTWVTPLAKATGSYVAPVTVANLRFSPPATAVRCLPCKLNFWSIGEITFNSVILVRCSAKCHQPAGSLRFQSSVLWVASFIQL